MKTYNNINELKEDSIHVINGTIAFFPQYNQEEALDVSWAPKFNGTFSVNNSTVAYVLDNMLYVTPYTRGVLNALDTFCFSRASFYVPFSNWDYPKNEEVKWKQLRVDASVDANEAFSEECIDFCERHRIHALDEEVLKKCFLIPDIGVQVNHFYNEDVHYPVLTSKILDCIAIDRLGSFSCNNGCVVFVYQDGHTYVAKGYGIIRALTAAGYRQISLFVPFSNGEQITNPDLAAKWDALPKQ